MIDDTITQTDTSPLSQASVTTPRDDGFPETPFISDPLPPFNPTFNPDALGVLSDAAPIDPAPAPITVTPSTPAPDAPHNLSVEDRLARLEDEVAFLRRIFGWPTKDDEADP